MSPLQRLEYNKTVHTESRSTGWSYNPFVGSARSVSVAVAPLRGAAWLYVAMSLYHVTPASPV